MRRRQLARDGLGDAIQRAFEALSFAGCVATWTAQSALLNEAERARISCTEYASRMDDVAKLRRARWDDLAPWLTHRQRAPVEDALAELPDEAREWVLALAADELDTRGSLGQLITTHFGVPPR